MNFSRYNKVCLIAVMAAVLVSIAVGNACAAKVQIFSPADPEKEIAPRILRDKAVSEAFAQALYTESVRMIPGDISPERGEALKSFFEKNYEDFITGYKDMNVKQGEEGVSVSIDVNVNRNTLRDVLRKTGFFVGAGSKVEAEILVSNEQFALNEEAQGAQNQEIDSLVALYGIQNATDLTAESDVVQFSVRHASKNRWSGDLTSSYGKWFASGKTMNSVWRNLWEKYHGANSAEAFMNPKAVLVVSGWFNPEGVREFGSKLKSWDSAVQGVVLQDVEMKPTAVSASWTLEVSDQWVLKSYLNDYLPPRGLTFNLEGLEGEE